MTTHSGGLSLAHTGAAKRTFTHASLLLTLYIPYSALTYRRFTHTHSPIYWRFEGLKRAEIQKEKNQAGYWGNAPYREGRGGNVYF